MSKPSTFTVYSASAGSGKTFTLVKEYLQILLEQKDIFHFQKVLAITFTNKAAAEMKERVIENLQCFARENSTDMLQVLMEATAMDASSIQKKSKQIIKAILNDYASFNITTIDSFTHRIIRAFAYDFGLSMDFNIEMDALQLIQESVDAVLAKIGVNKALTKTLVSYSLQKSDDDKSWDISKSLNEFARILLNESDLAELKEIEEKDFADYSLLQKKLNTQLASFISKFKELGDNGLQLISEAQIEHKDFYFSMLPKHFIALSTNWEKANFYDTSKLRERIEENTFYSAKKPADVKAAIENILPQLLDYYLSSERLYGKITLLKLFKESITPLAVLSNIHQALEQIKSDNNVRLIAEFNELIFNKIKDEPVPFIYERLGEKFQHFFIDEMQDTSILQWKNLSKLIENPLSQENGSLLLVGDAKQAIYRWRGGKSEQFIDLSDSSKQGPFQIKKTLKTLDTNYRSFTEIIKFNNAFFQHISSLLQNENHADLYKKENRQKFNSKDGGYVQLDFITKDKDDPDRDLLYPKKVLETIQNLDPNFEWKDVCVLVRKNKEGVAIASYLSENSIDIISSESLLLANDTKVHFLINLLQSLQQKNDRAKRLSLLNFLYQHANIKKEKHDFFSEFIPLEEYGFFKKLQELGYAFHPPKFHQKTLYDAMEYSIRAFKLTQESHAYLQYFLDIILEYQNQNGTDISGFLSYWELKREKLSISMPDGKNAVQIMTIHKAKGLQFPIVIYPYDLNIFFQINPKVWYPISDKEQYNGFSKLLIPYRKSLQYTDEMGFDLYYDRQKELELDNYNLLYVTLTRAVEQLYIITDYKIGKSRKGNKNFFSGLFIDYLNALGEWNPEQMQYSFGDKTRVKLQKEEDKSCLKATVEMETSTEFISSDIDDHELVLATKSAILWDSDQGKAIAYGNVLHEILAHIKTADDIDISLERFVNQGNINSDEVVDIASKIRAVVTHPKLIKYFDHNVTIYNEREILTDEKRIIIPDRLVIFPNNELVIIDYKTGAVEAKHKTQIQEYANVLRKMEFKVMEKLLVYIGDNVRIVAVDD